MPRPESGYKTYPRTAMLTAWRPTRLTITSMYRCPLAAAPIVNQPPRMVASACTHPSSQEGIILRRRPGSTAVDSGLCFSRRAELADHGFLVAHHLPVAIAVGPQLADEHPPEV